MDRTDGSGGRAPGDCGHAPPNPSIPPSASATCTCGSPTSTARSRSTATRSGFGVTADGREAGAPAAFLAAGDYHHHIGLNTFESAGATPPPPATPASTTWRSSTPTGASSAAPSSACSTTAYPIDHATDHGGTVSVYLDDPDGNGIELYYDRPRADWFDADGRPVLKADRFDFRELLPS